MHSRIIGLKEIGHVFPSEVSKLIIEKHTSTIGLAGLSPTDKTLIQGAGKGEQMPTLEDFIANQEKFKASRVVYTFTEAVGEVREDEMQPYFPVQDAAGKPLVSVFLSGEFTNFLHPDSEHSGEHQFYEGYLHAAIKAQFDAAGGKAETFYEKLKDKLFGMTMDAMCVPSNSIILYLSNGDALMWTKEQTAGDFSFGSLSNTLGYKEAAKAPVETPKSPVVKSLLAGLGDVLGVTAKPEVKTVGATTVILNTPQGSGPTVVDARKALADSTGIATVEKASLRSRPPENLSNKKIKTWYHNNAVGGLPPDWEKRPEALIKPESKLYAVLAHQMAHPEERPKDVEPHHIKTTSTHIPAPPTNAPKDTAPVVSAEEKKVIRDEILQNSKTISDPTKLQELEDTYAKFYEIAGYKSWNDMLPWTFDRYLELATKCPKSAALLCMNLVYRNDLLAKAKPKTPVEGEPGYLPIQQGAPKAKDVVKADLPAAQPKTFKIAGM